MADIKLDGLTVASSSGSPTALALRDIPAVRFRLKQSSDLSSRVSLSNSYQSITFEENIIFSNCASVSGSVYTLNQSGLYLINLSCTFVDEDDGNNDNERFAACQLLHNTTVVAGANDQISIHDASPNNYGAASLSYVGILSKNDTLEVQAATGNDGTGQLFAATHGSIICLNANQT